MKGGAVVVLVARWWGLIDVQGSDQQIAEGRMHVNTAGDEWQG